MNCIGKFIGEIVIVDDLSANILSNKGFGSRKIQTNEQIEKSYNYNFDFTGNNNNESLCCITKQPIVIDEPMVDSSEPQPTIDQKTLLLRDEEAFYLVKESFLIVYDIHNQIITLNELWNIFITKNNKFISFYKTYEFLKMKGFVSFLSFLLFSFIFNEFYN